MAWCVLLTSLAYLCSHVRWLSIVDEHRQVNAVALLGCRERSFRYYSAKLRRSYSCDAVRIHRFEHGSNLEKHRILHRWPLTERVNELPSLAIRSCILPCTCVSEAFDCVAVLIVDLTFTSSWTTVCTLEFFSEWSPCPLNTWPTAWRIDDITRLLSATCLKSVRIENDY